MELRAEPRFETRSSAVVEVIRDKVYTYDATITEVSGVGLRIETPEELRVGETIRLLVDGYHMFAQVRGSKHSGSGYIIGLERIDAWNGLAATATEKSVASPVAAVGRPALKNPLDNLHRAALGELFANPRFRTVQRKYQTVFIAAGCIALAGWAGFGAFRSIRSKPQGTTQTEAAPAEQLPAAPIPESFAPPKAAVANPIGSSKALPAPPVQTARVSAPPLVAIQTARVAATAPVAVQTAPLAAPAPPAVQPRPVPVASAPSTASVPAPSRPAPLAVRPAGIAASKISIKANDVSWVTVCVDGAKVIDTLLTKGYVGSVPFSRQATLRFGNAGAIEVAIGNQPPAKLGQAGEVRTIKVTPAGYELITVPSALNCNIH